MTDRARSRAIGAAVLALGLVLITDAWVPFLVLLLILLLLRLAFALVTMNHEG